jgi:hypothetical protein
MMKPQEIMSPHGLTVPVSDYRVAILAVTGWGLVAQLPYLQQLIHGYNEFSARTRRSHFQWQLDHIGKPRPAENP